MAGKVFTFYSYKGGVGRSMAMANIGALLALWGKKTLLIDWDLEAPGLENYFKQGNETRIAEFNKKEGLIDLLLKRKNNSTFSSADIKWSDFISTIPIQTKSNIDAPASIDILTAGRKDDTYIKRVREMDYGSFYDDHQGGAFLEEIREYWISRYDFVLIDSRTGLTDSSGICSIQMPDVLVMLFTATDLGFKGTLEIAQRAIKAQKSIIYDRYSLKVLPIPTRFDSTEFKLQQDWLSKFEQGLKPIYSTWVPDYPKDDKINIDHRKILDLTKLPYIPYFSYGESLPVIEQGTDDPQGLGYAFETVAAILSHNMEGAKLLVENRSEYVRRAVKGISPDYIEVKIEETVQATPKTNSPKYIITGFILAGILVSLLIVFGKNKIWGDRTQTESIQVDSLIRKIDIVTLQSFFASMDTNNIRDILELNKQVHTAGLYRDTTETIHRIRQTILKSVKDELEFTLPLIYQEIKSYDPKKEIDLSSNKDVHDQPMGPIEKYFSDTIQQFGPYNLILKENLQAKLNKSKLEGFTNSIEKDSIELVSADSSGFIVNYIEVGNYHFKDSSFVKNKWSLRIPVSMSFNSDLKINKLVYGQEEAIKDLSQDIKDKNPSNSTTVLPPLIQKPIQTRVEIFAVGNKSSKQVLQVEAIYEELLKNKNYLPRKAGWTSEKESDPVYSNQIRYNKQRFRQASALQDLLLKQLNISCSLYEVKTLTTNYFSIIVVDSYNRTNEAIQQKTPSKRIN